jgi:hypothetical protein
MTTAPAFATQSVLKRGRRLLLQVLCVLLAASSGCARWIELSHRPIDEGMTGAAFVQAYDRVPVVLGDVQVLQNGAPVTPQAALDRQVLGELAATHLFSEHIHQGYGQLQPETKFVTARLSLEETVDPHAGATAWKGFLIGASMFLLAPVIPLEYSYESHMTIDFERWDGLTRRYSTSTKGSAFYNLFGATPLAIQELKGQVIDACLAELMQQVVHDATLYLASSAPLPPSPSSTIKAEARASRSRSVPVSTNPGQPAQ